MSELSRCNQYETIVQLKKSFAVLEEIFHRFDNFSNSLPPHFKFLDLGAAPGGFSSFLLTDARCDRGYACTLPEERGGFRFMVEDPRLFVQKPAKGGRPPPHREGGI